MGSVHGFTVHGSKFGVIAKSIGHRAKGIERREKTPRTMHLAYFHSTYEAKFYELVKSRKTPFFVIPAKAGIQFFQLVTELLDSGFHRSDDFLRNHQCSL